MQDPTLYQPGILDGVPRVARYVLFTLADPAPAQQTKEAMTRISPLVNGEDVVIGLAPALVKALGGDVPGLRDFPDFSGQVKVPTGSAGHLWCWVRGDDLGDLLHVTRKLQKALAPAFTLRHVVDAFRHRHDASSGFGRDLTGFEDGTENPKGQDAIAAAFA